MNNKSMWIQDILSTKTDARDEVKSKYNLPKRSKVLVGIHAENNKSIAKIISGLSVLPANFVIFGWKENSSEEKNLAYTSSEDFNMSSLDALVCDCSDAKIEKLMEAGVVPIVNEKNYLGKILSEFHPGRAEGNAYLYEGDSHWAVYYALVRYLENHKFPYDNRNLVKNVIWL